jgi:Tfp pilus assembly PilM family ATPase
VLIFTILRQKRTFKFQSWALFFHHPVYSKEMKTTKVSNTNQQLAQKVYKCVNMFLEKGSVKCRKGSRRPTEDQLKILKRVKKELLQRLTQETNLSFGTVQLILKKDLHFFLYRVSVV